MSGHCWAMMQQVGPPTYPAPRQQIRDIDIPENIVFKNHQAFQETRGYRYITIAASPVCMLFLITPIMKAPAESEFLDEIQEFALRFLFSSKPRNLLQFL
jgi:hypothetical protein